MIQCVDSSDEDMSGEEKSVIFEQNVHNSEQASESDGLGNNFCSQPPKMLDQLFRSSSMQDSNKLDKPWNLVAQNLYSVKKKDSDEFRWTEKSAPK